MPVVVAWLAILLGCYWSYMAWRIQRGVMANQRLPNLSDLPSGILDGTVVSIIIAARNEAERIGETVRRLAGQESIRFELIVVNDRSTDDTGHIVAEIAADNPRVSLVEIDTLPQGWLGKCNACWQGARQSRGDWLLFTDGDAHMTPELVARAVATGKQEKANHVALLPYVIADAFWTRVALIGQTQLFTLYTSPETINADRSSRWIGVGAFNLFDRDTYFSIGGHEAVRMEVVEDMKLGYLIRKDNHRQRAYSGVGDLEVDWATSIKGIFAATEKNWFAAMDYRLGASIAAFLFIPGTILVAVLAPWFAGPVGWFPFFSMFSLSIPGYYLARQFGWPGYIGPFSPFGWLVFTWAGVNSVWHTLRKGGIHWRDRFYPLDELREGVVR